MLAQAQLEDGRPALKAILLAGAPGIGKTTLAHIAARHCGYRVVEINASDERSGPALMNAVAAAVQMQPVLGERRPNCLVIDEIDGAASEGHAGTGAVRALTQIITSGQFTVSGGDGRSAAGLAVTGASTGGRKKRRAVQLMRPIICICNDLYAPVLRPLRASAHVLVMHPPTAHVLTTRLREVCRKERVKVHDRVRLCDL